MFDGMRLEEDERLEIAVKRWSRVRDRVSELGIGSIWRESRVGIGIEVG